MLSQRAACALLGRAYLRRRYAILFYTLLLTIVAAPVVAAFELKGSLMEFFLAANLLAAVMPVGAGRDRRILLDHYNRGVAGTSGDRLV